MEIRYSEERAFMTLEDFERIVKRVSKRRMIHQEWMQSDEHPLDTKEPVVVEDDRNPIRWLSDFIKD